MTAPPTFTPPTNIVPMVAPTIDADRSKGMKDEKGRWIRGPGRVAGSKNKHSSDLLKQVRSMSGRAIAALSDAIDKGEKYAIEIVLRYSLPNGRTVELFEADAENVREAFCEGDISTSEFREISTSLEKLASLDSIEDIRTRLAQLEAMLKR